MKTVPLKAYRRERIGRQLVKKVRSEKRIPAVVYGGRMKPESIEVAADDFSRAVHTKAGENAVIQLSISGPKTFEKTVVIKEIQLHPVTDAILHVDFNAISLTEKIKVKVPLAVKGESLGVKEGGVLDVVHHEIEVECLPTDIPERIEADISALKIGDSLHLSDLKIPSSVHPELALDEVVVTVHAPKAEEAPAPEEAPAEPELIKKEKKEGEEEASEAAPAEAKKEKSAEGEKEKAKEK